jgi:hypothetical protein
LVNPALYSKANVRVSGPHEAEARCRNRQSRFRGITDRQRGVRFISTGLDERIVAERATCEQETESGLFACENLLLPKLDVRY